jgi:hypothetical protein
MFGTIRKHQTWLWGIIITVTIISFVFFFSPTQKYDNARRGSDTRGFIGGEKITDQDVSDAFKEVELRFFVNYHQWPGQEAKQMGFDADRETYQRLFFIRKAQEHNIQVDSAAVARVANSIFANVGRGNPVSLDTFSEQVLKPQKLTPDDFERFIRHELEIQQLYLVLGVSGRLITPAEAQTLYIREHQEISAEPVFFSASNYLANVSAPSTEALLQFYTNRLDQYQIPERMQVSYVKFNATNFYAEADQQITKITNFNSRVEETARQQGTNGNLTVEERKTKIRDEVRQQLALETAYKKANEFAVKLDNIKPPLPQNLAALAQTNGLTPKVSEPFSDYPPDDIGPVKDFIKIVSGLSEETPFAEPIVGKDAVYVVAFNKRIPAEVPPFEKIHSQVESDYKLNEAGKLARRAGAEFANTLTNGLAQGKTFADVCAAAKVKPTVVPPVSLSTRELPELEHHISVEQFRQIALDTPVGKSSSFIPTIDGGVVIYVRDHLPIDQAKMRADMPQTIQQLRQMRENEAVNFWFRREVERDAGFREIMEQLAKRNQRNNPQF